jgi:hypothetical protein
MTNYAWISLVLATGACGGPAAEAPSGSPSTTTTGPTVEDAHSQDSGVARAAVRDAAVPEAAPPEHPFAATPADATNLIDAAIDARVGDLARCVETARAKRKNPHKKISVKVGIDEQGHLMGVEAPPAEPKDPDLYVCVQGALIGANFPTSHAGIITVTRSFEEQAVYK